MSAFVCTDRHVAAIVAAAVAGSRDPSPLRCLIGVLPRAEALEWIEQGEQLWELFPRVCSLLRRENLKSVNFRYRQAAEIPGPFTVPFAQAPKVAAVAALKLLDCYDYQSCEHPGWEGSTGEQISSQLRRFLIRALPGYEDARWSLDD